MTQDRHGRTWPMEAHTKAKHEVLRRYLGAWFPKLRWARRLLYIDGFAGPGVYDKGEPGSPLVALGALLDHGYFADMDDCEFVFLFCESDERRFSTLEGQLAADRARRGGWPANVKVYAVNEAFEEAVSSLMASVQEGEELAPTLAFLDPFGVKGLPMATVGKLLAHRRAELLVNVALRNIARFRNIDEMRRHLCGYFGLDNLPGDVPVDRFEAVQYFGDLYERQLREQCGVRYTQSFQMRSKGQVSYHLVYATNSADGLAAMKTAMWKVDPLGDFTFSGRLDGQALLLGEGAALDTRPLQDALAQRYAGQDVAIEDVETFVRDETIYRHDGHLKQHTLALMEREGRVEVVTSPRQRARSYPAGTVLRFPQGAELSLL